MEFSLFFAATLAKVVAAEKENQLSRSAFAK